MCFWFLCAWTLVKSPKYAGGLGSIQSVSSSECLERASLVGSDGGKGS